jgi:hypothetical protein
MRAKWARLRKDLANRARLANLHATSSDEPRCQHQADHAHRFDEDVHRGATGVLERIAEGVPTTRRPRLAAIDVIGENPKSLTFLVLVG